METSRYNYGKHEYSIITNTVYNFSLWAYSKNICWRGKNAVSNYFFLRWYHKGVGGDTLAGAFIASTLISKARYAYVQKLIVLMCIVFHSMLSIYRTLIYAVFFVVHMQLCMVIAGYDYWSNKADKTSLWHQCCLILVQFYRSIYADDDWANL